MTTTTDVGIAKADLVQVVNPLPTGWVNVPAAPVYIPAWANVDKLSSTMLRNLQSQIGYDFSNWDYKKIGPNQEVGRYQVTAQTLENYGLLAKGSVASLGQDAVNHKFCWQPAVIRKNTNSYANYVYNISNLFEFLSHPATQDHLSYQIIYDIYNSLKSINLITDADSADVAAGMVYVGWVLGVGQPPGPKTPHGTGAYAWRYHGDGDGVRFFNAGRYAVTILSQ
jgi:hypothetical protein